MQKRVARRLALACVGLLITALPAAAQQTLNFTIGAFTLRATDARVEGDVLNENLNFLAFDTDDFNSVTVGGEWLVPLGNYFEGGVGVGFSQSTVPSIYADFVDNDGTEIEQDLKLRIVPVAFTFRVTPLGRSSAVQPYFGAGLGVFNWRYSESGEFVDFGGGNAIFRDQFVDSGSETGPIVLGGIRFAGKAASAGFEVKYQAADAELDNIFAGPRIDLGGWTYNFTVGVRF